MTSEAVEGTWICMGGLCKMVENDVDPLLLCASSQVPNALKQMKTVLLWPCLFLGVWNPWWSTRPCFWLQILYWLSLWVVVFSHLSLSQEYMPLPPGEEEEKSSDQNSEPKLQFSYVECLIFAFHQLAKKVWWKVPYYDCFPPILFGVVQFSTGQHFCVEHSSAPKDFSNNKAF